MENSTTFNFAEQPDSFVHSRLIELAANLRDVPYGQERAREVGREALHLYFEVRYRAGEFDAAQVV